MRGGRGGRVEEVHVENEPGGGGPFASLSEWDLRGMLAWGVEGTGVGNWGRGVFGSRTMSPRHVFPVGGFQ